MDESGGGITTHDCGIFSQQQKALGLDPVGTAKDAEAARAAKVSTHSGRWVVMAPPLISPLPTSRLQFYFDSHGTNLLVNPNKKWQPAWGTYKSLAACNNEKAAKMAQVVQIILPCEQVRQYLPERNNVCSERTLLKALAVRDVLAYGICEER